MLLSVRASGFRVEEKPGGAGPVTEADRRANALVVEALAAAFPADAVVAEESPPPHDAALRARCWFVDPLDGTQEFVEGRDDFAVHIGLAAHGTPALGVVYVPAARRLYEGGDGVPAAVEDDPGRRPLRLRAETEPDLWTMLVSRTHAGPTTDDAARLLGIRDVVRAGSVGVKVGRLCEGAADLYVHASRRTCRWDTCAPEAVLRACGGVLTDLAGNPYRYEGSELLNPRGLLAGSAAVHRRALPVVRDLARAAGLVP